MFFPAAGSTWHGISYFSFCGSLLGNTLDREIKENNSTEFLNQNLEKRFWHPYCVSINIGGVFRTQSALTALNVWQFLR